MATTIQVSGTTKQLLDHLKEKEHAETYDALIQHLVKTHADVPASMYGAVKGLKKWKKEDRLGLHEL
jgi:hypothetical protein